MAFDPKNEGYDPDDDEKNMIFHYHREERLKHAPQIVRDYYDGKFKPYRSGLFRSLVSTKSNRFMFTSIVIVAAVIFILGFFHKDNQDFMAGVRTNLTAFSYAETVYVSVELSDAPKKFDKSLPLPLNAEIQAVNTDGQVAEIKKISGKYEGKSAFFRTTFSDYDILEVTADLTFAGESCRLKSRIQKR